MAIIYTKHAKEMLILRRIKQELANQCATNPDHILPTEKVNNKIIITVHWLAKKRVNR